MEEERSAEPTQATGSAGEETMGVVPVFVRRTKSGDGGMKLDHAMRHGVAGGIGVEAAEDGRPREIRDHPDRLNWLPCNRKVF